MSSPEIRQVQAIVSASIGDRSPVRVLEAGCGSLPATVDLGDRAHVVGIDVSERQLRDNTTVAEKILGDLQTHAFPPQSFDLVFCWDVLEHLDRPAQALDNLVAATRPGGLIVLKVPNPRSAKGLFTKLTPHWFHVWYYRRVRGYPNAGKPGYTPFRTVMHPSTTPSALLRFASERKLDVAYSARYEASVQTALRTRIRLTGPAWAAAKALTRALTLGRIDLEGTELLLVLRPTAR